MSWSDFLGLSDLTPIVRQDMERAPQLLAAMTATESDARTQGNVATQLLLDPISRDERVDSTLNAPTTVAWFAPWKDYLLSQNVQFIPGELVGFKPDAGNTKIVPDVKADAEPPNFEESDYFVLALPVQAWSKDTALFDSWAAA